MDHNEVVVSADKASMVHKFHKQVVALYRLVPVQSSLCGMTEVPDMVLERMAPGDMAPVHGMALDDMAQDDMALVHGMALGDTVQDGMAPDGDFGLRIHRSV